MFPTEEIIKKYNLYWQYPVITEYIFYMQEKSNNNYLGIPWLTIINDKIHVDIFSELYNYIDKSISYYTCCQSIHFKNIIPYLKKLNVKILYIPHKIYKEDIIDEIIIKPCPIYAINIEQEIINNSFKGVDLLNKKRKYLYTFMGAWQKNYLTHTRLNLLNLPKNNESLIITNQKWHFNDIVFGKKQNSKYEQHITQNYINDTILYNDLLLESRFSLCPSGSGPGTIRFWESLAVGSIPVLLSDTLELPEHELWNDAIIRIKESDYLNIPKILESIQPDKEFKMKKNCLDIYNFFKNNYKGNQDIQLNNTFNYKLPIKLVLNSDKELTISNYIEYLDSYIKSKEGDCD